MSTILVQVIVGGLLLGAVYALFSSGLTLIWGMMNIVNFAHGDFVMLGMYVAFVVWTLFGVGPFHVGDVLAFEQDLARCRQQVAGQAVEQSGFARAIRADQAENVALFQSHGGGVYEDRNRFTR